MEYFEMAIRSIELRKILPANHVWGMKCLRKETFSIKLNDTATWSKSIRALTRNPMPTNRLNLSFNLRACKI